MKNKLDLFSKLCIVNSILIVIQLSAVIFQFDFLPSKIPIFYTRPWGEDQLTGKYWIFFLPAFSLIFFFLSIIFKKFLLKKDDGFLTTSSLLFSVLFSTLCLISILKIITLVN